ncbi:hypothetical protein OUZ56_001634 [Daphnia magna]|uniref:Uncharacterized protein n=1 Tax=Daphnia magna TaxID=35525 RepID=A0ABR0A3A4_9CRUS|nr:hypothetical protein OUZ56_001634 [Daphnia magna]
MTSSIRPTLPLGSGGLERARSSYYSNFKRKSLWPSSEANSFQQPVNALAYGLAVDTQHSASRELHWNVRTRSLEEKDRLSLFEKWQSFVSFLLHPNLDRPVGPNV